MSARGSDFQRSLGVRLPAYLGKVGVVGWWLGFLASGLAFVQRTVPGQVGTYLQERVGRQYGCLVRQCRFVSAFARQDKRLAIAPASQDHRQSSADGAKMAGKRELASELVSAEGFGGDLSGGGENPERDGQVETSGLLG